MAKLLSMVFLLGFAIGSIPTGYWLGYVLANVDVRKSGSGNLGATNVFRVLGWKAGVTTLVIDIGKGYLAVEAIHLLVGHWLVFPMNSSPLDNGLTPDGWIDVCLWIAGIGALLGHTFSPFVKFRGGKGVATAAGVFLALLPLEATISLVTFVLVFAWCRIVSLSSMLSALMLTIATFFITKDMNKTLMTSALAAFIIWRHRTNIQRLINGTENQISWHKKNA